MDLEGAPDPQELFMGTRVTVNEWFKDFEAYVDRRMKGKIHDRQWFSALRNLCVNHQGMKSLLDSLRENDSPT